MPKTVQFNAFYCDLADKVKIFFSNGFFARSIEKASEAKEKKYNEKH